MDIICETLLSNEVRSNKKQQKRKKPRRLVGPTAVRLHSETQVATQKASKRAEWTIKSILIFSFVEAGGEENSIPKSMRRNPIFIFKKLSFFLPRLFARILVVENSTKLSQQWRIESYQLERKIPPRVPFGLFHFYIQYDGVAPPCSAVSSVASQ